MPLADYYEKFYIQERKKVPDGFGGTEWKLLDGTEIDGLYRQDTSGDQRRAEANGTASGGLFVTSISAPVFPGDFIRRESDSLYLRVVSLPVKSHDRATSKFKEMNVEKTEAVV